MPRLSHLPPRISRTLATLKGVSQVALLSFLFAGCLAPLAGGQSLPLPLNAEAPSLNRVGALEYRGGLVLGLPDGDFGGLSALEVDPDGGRVVALSDRGAIVTLRLDYDEKRRLRAAHDIKLHDLADAEGGLVAGRRSDAEGLARLPDGRWAVSFEHRHRLQLHADAAGIPGAALVGIPQPPGLGRAPRNGGIEALTALPDGRLFAIEEGTGKSAGRHRAWLCDSDCVALDYRGQEPFRPTGATTLPNGDLLILERRASMLGGFGARIVRVRSEDVRGGAVVSGEELARIEPPLSVDNFEGIAAIPAPGGGTDIYLISDNNFWALQRTLLMVFHLRD